MQYQPRQIRRGSNAQRVALGGLAAGEWGFETDLLNIYIGSAAGDKKISGVAEWVHLNGQDQAVKTTSSPLFEALTVKRILWPVTSIVRIGYLAGDTWNPTTGNPNSTFVGNWAGCRVTTGGVCAFGVEAAAYTTTGTVDAFGDGAALHNISGVVCAFGHGACDGNLTGAAVGVGYHAAFKSLVNCVAVGHECLGLTTTGVCVGVGMNVGFNNVTGAITGMGDAAAYSCVSANIVAFGQDAARASQTADLTAIGFGSLQSKTADKGTGLGWNSGRVNVSGFITAIGWAAAYAALDGNSTSLGYGAMFANQHPGAGLYLGAWSGAYETGENKFFVNTLDRATEAGDRALSLMYGVFAAASANQRLRVNGRLGVTHLPNYANNTAALAGGLISGEFYTVTASDPLQVAAVI